jgi:uncharacterized membrane protein
MPSNLQRLFAGVSADNARLYYVRHHRLLGMYRFRQQSSPFLAPSSVLRPRGEKLGFLRFWQVYFISVVAFRITQLLFISQEQASFGFDDYLAFCDVVFAGIAAWLIMERKRVTRPFVCAYCLSMLIVEVIGDILLLRAGLILVIIVSLSRVLLLLSAVYFFFSRQVRAKLVMPFDVAGGKVFALANKGLYRPRDLAFWRDVGMFFMVSSVLGHWMERAYGVFVRHFLDHYDPTAPLWQDYLSPFNIYGMGATACILVLVPLKDILARRLNRIWLVLPVSYAANTLACTAIELGVGLLVNHPDATGHLTKWDYSDMPLNFMGQICLQNALIFGLIATLVVWYAFPAVEGLILRRSRDTANLVFVAVSIVYLLLAAFYLIDLRPSSELQELWDHSALP